MRLVVVDDHPAIRHFLVAIARTVGGMVVVGEAESGGEALGVVAALHPDVLVLDDHLPDQSGLSVAQHVRANDPDVRILVYTGVPDLPDARRLLALGVDGYLRKTASLTETITAIRAVGAGQRVVDPRLAKELAEVHGVTLTPREIEVLRLVVSGLSNSAIATLGRSDKTIEAHLGHLHDKLGVHARSAGVPQGPPSSRPSPTRIVATRPSAISAPMRSRRSMIVTTSSPSRNLSTETGQPHYTGPGQAERASAGWAASNPDTPWGNTTTTYGSGMLSQTNSAGSETGTIHCTHDPYGTLIAQRVPGASSNYYYLPDKDGSVLRMVDSGSNVLATYDYCPTGNAPGDLTMTTIAQNNPYRYLGMYDDPGSKMLYDGNYIESQSGIRIQLCPLPFGPFGTIGLPCLTPLPLLSQSTQQVTSEQCQGFGPADREFKIGKAIVFASVRGPEWDEGYGCHVNAQLGVLNHHINFAPDVGFTSDVIGWAGATPADAAVQVSSAIEPGTSSRQRDIRSWFEYWLNIKLEQLAGLYGA